MAPHSDVCHNSADIVPRRRQTAECKQHSRTVWEFAHRDLASERDLPPGGTAHGPDASRALRLDHDPVDRQALADCEGIFGVRRERIVSTSNGSTPA